MNTLGQFKSLVKSGNSNSDTKMISFRIPSYVYEELQLAVKLGEFKNVSEFLKEKVFELINEKQNEIRKFKNEFLEQK